MAWIYYCAITFQFLASKDFKLAEVNSVFLTLGTIYIKWIKLPYISLKKLLRVELNHGDWDCGIIHWSCALHFCCECTSSGLLEQRECNILSFSLYLELNCVNFYNLLLCSLVENWVIQVSVHIRTHSLESCLTQRK